jgi:molybdenum cofactor synthesis domain-containing protein
LFKKLLSFNEAKQILEKTVSVKPIGVEKVSLSNAHNRVLAQDIVSPINIPPFTRSTVDGYAVKAANTFGASEDHPIRFKLCGHVSIGEAPKVAVKNGLVAEIVTGAPLPRGADSVVMVEYTNHLEDDIYVHRPVTKGENVMVEGSDIHKNENVLKKGRFLGSREIGVLAAIGLIETTVYRRPKVAVLSTGEEVIAPGEPLPAGKIYDINAYTLSAAVQEAGGESINLGIIPDNKDLLTKILVHALDSADVVITSGGVSVGPKDFTPQVVHSLGKPGVIISGVAVKPGKPLTVAVVDGKPVFSLPGNPTSSLFMFNVFVRPILIKLAGGSEQEVPKIQAFVSQKLFPARGRRTFIMVKLSCDQSGRLIASPVPTGLSGAITTLANADGFVEISEQQQFVDAGVEIDVNLFGKIRKLETD